MAEFAAMGGSRRIEFLHLTLPQIDSQRSQQRPAATACDLTGRQIGTASW